MPDLQPIPESLLSGPTFAGAPREAVEAFLAERPRLVLGDGAPLFMEGDEGGFMAIVMSGCLRISLRVDPDGDLELGRACEGDVVGEMSVLSPGPRAATARVLGSATLLLITREALLSGIKAVDPVVAALLRFCTRRMAIRLRHTDQRLSIVYDAARGADVDELEERLAHLDEGLVSDMSLTTRDALESQSKVTVISTSGDS